MAETRGMPAELFFNNSVLCVNCLRPGAAEVPVGEFGGQRDLERVEHRLCRGCAEALLLGEFDLLGERRTDRRTVDRSDLGGAR